jgi:antitoxin (DNA-binding transcriptional repressor) of toxin-antitoxin stability system
MVTIRLEEMEDNLLACLGRIPEGESAIIVDDDEQPVAEVKPLAGPVIPACPRPFGLAKGEFVVPDDFDAPLPEEFMRPFVEQ